MVSQMVNMLPDTGSAGSDTLIIKPVSNFFIGLPKIWLNSTLSGLNTNHVPQNTIQLPRNKHCIKKWNHPNQIQ